MEYKKRIADQILADKLEASNRLSEGLIVSKSMTVAC